MIEYIKNDIREIFKNDSGGHDYWHSIRVYKNALKILEKEGGQRNLVSIAALLHDVDDKKLFCTEDYYNARTIMNKYKIEQNVQESVIDIISNVSFRDNKNIIPKTIEGMIVQDADRLDALGAIGIARTFAYGGSRGTVIYDPEIKPKNLYDAEDYLEGSGTSVNHFFEKLFLLKELMNTDTAKVIAENRVLFMHEYLKEFFSEWEGI